MSSDLPLDLDRHLIRHDSRQVPVYRTDLVVLGGGVAGASAALTAARAGLSVAVIAKSELGESNTRYAQGGLAAVFGAQDSFESHVTDTLLVGCGLGEPEAVEAIVRGGPAAVEALIGFGCEFDRDASGGLELSREGGHSRARVIHAGGDSTGRVIQRALERALVAAPEVTAFPGTFAIDLLCDEDGRVVGVLTQNDRGNLVAYSAPNVLLATGGAGQIYRETTNPPVATGDGVAMAIRAGARVRDLEFVQFHPTCLYIAGAARVLISEVVRGHGGILRDRTGARFMPDFHPDAELAPRDVVSRAVFRRMVETSDTNVYLDLSEVDGDPHALFPGISRVCGVFGIDIARDPIPVRPGAHYFVGGVAIDLDGRTSLPGLWAAGECGSSGLHGANRMGSNSLLEGLVLGIRCGRELVAARDRADGPRAFHGGRVHPAPEADLGLKVSIEDITYSLKSMMWRHMGVQREAAGLRETVEKIGFWSRVVQDLAEPQVRTYELLNMLTVARFAAYSALLREESRGVHWRTDFPATADGWRAHLDATPVVAGDVVSHARFERRPVAAPEGPAAPRGREQDRAPAPQVALGTAARSGRGEGPASSSRALE